MYFIRTVQCRYYCTSPVHCTVSVLLLPQQCTVQRLSTTADSAVPCAVAVLLLPQQYTVQCRYYCTSVVHCTLSVLLHLSSALYTRYYYCLSSAVEECHFVVRSETSSNLAGCAVTAFTQWQMFILCGLLIIYLRFRHHALNWANKTGVIYAASIISEYLSFIAGEPINIVIKVNLYCMYIYNF